MVADAEPWIFGLVAFAQASGYAFSMQLVIEKTPPMRTRSVAPLRSSEPFIVKDAPDLTSWSPPVGTRRLLAHGGSAALT